MKDSQRSRIGALIKRVGAIRTEFNHAQRRLFEVRTGITQQRSRPRR